ncbi:hypothetical protein N0V90_003274 [Kalmusia sp. IMI 367209]|nr:hypothetical protein N0V90_003274 [Kalmusia sp. IMI 367209]
MRLIALADMAVEISKAGGLGFIGSGTDTSTLSTDLSSASALLSNSHLHKYTDVLPIGIGFINWGASLSTALPLISRYRPAAVWFFAPSSLTSLQDWTTQTRKASPRTKIWIQIGSVREAISVVQSVRPDVLIVQGTDAGGHGLVQGASLMSLLPEVDDAVSQLCEKENICRPALIGAGGIIDSRGASAALTLGAHGTVLGTRLLASPEANISKGYREEVLRATDGGQSTVRTKVYDMLRGTTGWAETHNGRGLINRSYVDAVSGMSDEENKRLYEEEIKKGDAGWGVEARMTTYAGSGVGLVREVKRAGDIVREVREGTKQLLKRWSSEARAGKL